MGKLVEAQGIAPLWLYGFNLHEADGGEISEESWQTQEVECRPSLRLP